MSMQTGITQYGSRTLVGNWSEDVQEDEIKFAEYLARKRKDELLLSERHAVFQHALQSCPLTYRCEGDSVCYGDSIMLENVETQGYLAVHPHGQSWAVSTWKTEDIRPVARNVFRIVLPSGEAPLDTPLRFGDTFCLVCDPVSFIAICHLIPLINIPVVKIMIHLVSTLFGWLQLTLRLLLSYLDSHNWCKRS